MKERPILFSAPMVRAILEGRKTQTRRIVKPPRGFKLEQFSDGVVRAVHGDDVGDQEPCVVRELRGPYGEPGDRLWVREAWGLRNCESDPTDWERGSVRGCSEDEVRGQYHLDYRADWGPMQEGCYWRPGIHMPRWASRITLEVTGVRVERLHAITEEDARAEGVDSCDGEYDAAELCRIAKMAGSSHEDARGWFAWLWCQINGEDSWGANPFVWVVEFKRVGVGPEVAPR